MMAARENGEVRRNREHREKMRRVKAARDRLMATKTDERGLVIVTTGNGKGKTTAAMGMALRCVGHGFKVGIVQFIKGAIDSAERKALEAFPDLVTFRVMGEGFTWETQDRERDMAAARAAFEAELREIQSLGCELKDTGQGLIDFPGWVEGSIAYLCWQRGEGSVAFWHTLEGGFAARRPLRP